MSQRQAKTLEYMLFTIPTGLRFLLYAVVMLLGLSVQFIFYFPGHGSAGIVLVTLGGLLMIGSTYSKVPKDLGFEDWKPVTNREFERVLRNYSLVRQAKIPVILKKKEGRIVFLVLSIFSFMFLGFLSIASSHVVFFLVALDIIIFLYPLFLSGHVTVHAPKELELKMGRFYAVMLLSEELKNKGISITPYFRFDKDSEGNHIPEDVRLMLEPKWKPSDVVGIQLQVTINNGPNGAVPYMYAVIICRGRDRSYKYLEQAPWIIHSKEAVLETGSEDEFTFLIIRQGTEGGGYHTTDDDCQALVRQIAENLYPLQLHE